MPNHDPLLTAYESARDRLLAERETSGHWIGELSTSALSTATAVSALSLVERHNPGSKRATPKKGTGTDRLDRSQSPFSQLVESGIRWLAEHQNDDGGWGDTEKSYSNIATTMLGVAAFHLTGRLAGHVDLLERAERYIDKQGRIAGLRKRYGKDKTFAVPILTNCALAGLVDWKEVSPLPFEAACVPQRLYRFLKLPVVSYAIPALVGIGQARYFHKKPWNPVARIMRKLAVVPSLKVLRRMQPKSGGYLEAVPLTSFVVMSLAATGRADHPVVRSGVQFIIDSVRPDGSWPIDTNLATWNTTLSLNALAAAGDDLAALDSDVEIIQARRASEGTKNESTPSLARRACISSRCLDWLLSCQYTEVHPFTGAAPGGWGWSDLSGSVPDADDTPSSLLALSNWYRSKSCRDEDRERIQVAATNGIRWLLDLQNSDGGWPTFCRGWGKLPFDRSGADLTAHAIRALHVWRNDSNADSIDSAIARGFRFVERQQADDGSWIPLWFGNQVHPREENPVYGTAKVLMAYRDLGRIDTQEARRGLSWLTASQSSDGSWGAGPEATESASGSVEETAMAIEALLSDDSDETIQVAAEKGLEWLVDAVEAEKHRESSPIGFYFAKLWYHERLYPQIFTVSALGHALRAAHLRPGLKPAEAPKKGQTLTNRMPGEDQPSCLGSKHA